MIFKKRLNNNVVIALDENGQEKILCGKGLGFQMKEQGTVEESRVEKVFALADQVMNRRLQEFSCLCSNALELHAYSVPTFLRCD